ncbi:hypothetical protein BGZ99_000359 [Dissophora globulifera]|uniref:Ubiquitin-like domain-containing protein n=1 Tax=Dissophora globulifera TaxID=979702 RepID=A0A9P6UYI8_9FUNG|nr:hypothetical protein BGZ99_000359 [Dissophora globulifera]
MSTVEESLFISQFLAAYASQPTKYPVDYLSPGLAPNWTSKRATFERPAKPVRAGAAQGDIQVTIKSLKSGQWTVDVSAQGTIANLKEALQAKAGIEVGAQRLVLKGKALLDSKKLEEYGLMTGSVVHLFSKAVTAPTEVAADSSSSSATATAAAVASTTPPSSVQDIVADSTEASATTGGASGASAAKRPAVTSYRGLSEGATAIAKDAEFWYWLNDQLKERLGSKEDASLMMKGFLGQYRDLIGNSGTKEIENKVKK